MSNVKNVLCALIRYNFNPATMLAGVVGAEFNKQI